METQSKTPAIGDADRPLTGKQDLFCQQYVILNNATEAAKAAGYSKRSARFQGAENLTKPNIKKRVDELRAEIRERNKVKEDELIERLGWVVRSDLAEIFHENGGLLPLSEIPEGSRYAISGLEIFEEYEGRGEDRRLIGHTKKVKLASKLDAIDKLLRVYGSYEKDNKQRAGEDRRATMVLSNGTVIDL